MPRKPRIEYQGAVYHIMNRGDRGGKVFKDRLDYELFLNATAEVCERTGWCIHAYVLLRNHFHWLLETPEANLVAGMKWFLGAYSQRFNARHGQRGHVFQGRYKAVLIDGAQGDYFETVSTYVHLNPVRAGLLGEGQEGLRQYEWSSLAQYLKPKRQRPAWLRVERVLGNVDLADSVSGRRGYQQYMEGRVRELRTKAGKKQFKEAWKPIRYGWYVGGEAFKEELVKKLVQAVKGKQRASYSGEAIRKHDEHQAERVVAAGMKLLGLAENAPGELPKGDERKCVLAWLAHSRTMASHKWIAERLGMGCPSNMTHYIAKVRSPGDARMSRLRNKIEKAIPK